MRLSLQDSYIIVVYVAGKRGSCARQKYARVFFFFFLLRLARKTQPPQRSPSARMIIIIYAGLYSPPRARV